MNIKSRNSLMISIVAMVGMSTSICRGDEDTTFEYLEAEALQYAEIMASQLEQDNKIYYVTTNSLNVRSGDSTAASILGRLSQNDEVRIVNGIGLSGKFVEIEIVKSSLVLNSDTKKYVSSDYLTDKKMTLRDRDFKYLMIQNIATEKVRVYEKVCEDLSCPHKMILETNMVVGQPGVPDEMTWLGSYRITGWQKFYQDGKANYPSWYDPNYPAVPSTGSSFMAWRKNKRMPMVNGERHGSMRGAFGWYTALVGPNHNAQWTHGTIGWGADKDRFIKKTKTFMANLVTAPRSHGCSRVDNETIAYLRHILPVGTPHIKIYAKEALLDKNRSGYTTAKTPWHYILTKNGVRTNGQGADRNLVLASNVTRSDIIEEGTYMVNQYPSVVEYTPGESLGKLASKFKNAGNIYRTHSSNMYGVFYVDAGVVSNYQHPQGLQVGGYKDEIVPDFINIDRMNIR